MCIRDRFTDGLFLAALVLFGSGTFIVAVDFTRPARACFVVHPVENDMSMISWLEPFFTYLETFLVLCIDVYKRQL